MMNRFEVIDLSPDGEHASLLDADGQLHVARLQGCRLRRDDVLHGREAKPGAHLLLADPDRRPLHVCFKLVRCSQDDALALMHPAGAGLVGDTMG